MLRTALTKLARVSKQLFIKEAAPLWALLILATLIRLPLMPFKGYWKDLATYVTWGNDLVRHGFSNLYVARNNALLIHNGSFQSNTINIAVAYPPGTPYLFALVELVYHFTLEPILHAPLPDLMLTNGVGPFVAKLVFLASDLATITLLYHEARKRHSQRFAWLATASFALSPAVLYDGIIWGQTDALVMLPVLVAVFAIVAQRYALSGVCFALAALIKPQPVIFIPFVLLYLWRWTQRADVARFIGALLGTLLLLLLPLTIPRFQLFDMLDNMRTVSYNDLIYVNQGAFNFWWVTGLASVPMGSSLLGVKVGLIGDALFGVTALVIGRQIWRHSEPAYLFFGLALVGYGFFMFMGGQHERYLFPSLPLLLATLIVSKRTLSNHIQALYVAGTVLCLLNMLVTVAAYLEGDSPMLPYATLQSVVDFITTNFGSLTFAIAAYIVVTFALAMLVFLSGRFMPLSDESPALGHATLG